MTKRTIARLIGEVDRIRPLIADSAKAAESDRKLADDVYRAMFDAGLFSMIAPRAHGGMELHLVEAMSVWEAVARIDASAAWNLVMNQAIAGYAAWLSPEGVAELFGDGPTTVAGALFPPQPATRVDGGWKVTGQVPFGSGCHHAEWLAMPAVEMEGDQPKVDPDSGQPVPFAVFFRRTDAKILDTWHTLGMRGTGSTDYAVENVFVPDHLTAPVGPLATPAPGFDGPLFRMWPWTAILGEATVSVGIADAAVNEAVSLCGTKTPAYNARPLTEHQLTHYQLGKAKARVEAARDTLYRAAEQAHSQLADNTSLLSTDSKIRLQLAVCFAAEACAEAVRFVNDATGSSSFRTEFPFERHFRDSHMLLQHSSKSSPRYGSAGRLMLGLENDWVWLSF